MECAAASVSVEVFTLSKQSVAREGMVRKSGCCSEEGTKSGAVREREVKRNTQCLDAHRTGAWRRKIRWKNVKDFFFFLHKNSLMLL